MVLDCNYMNEGCDGGISIVNGLLMENGHFVPESCAPYAPTQNFNGCSEYAKCEKIAKVSKSYYPSGFKEKPTTD
jgi:hypothetical protein